jgi:Ribosome biogenesis protein Nop16
MRYDPKPKIDAMLKPHWDPSKTAAVNLENMGLCGKPKGLFENDPNKRTTATTEKNGTSGCSKAIEIFDIPQSDIIEPSRREKFPLTEEEELYILNCMIKHGTDYSKIFRDTKINYLQYTDDKIRKLGSRFVLLQPNQRRIQELPEKIQDIITTK